MRKKNSIIKGVVGTLLVLAAAGAAVGLTYTYNDTFKNWVDSLRGTEEEDSSTSEAEVIENDSGTLQVNLPRGRVFNVAPTLGETYLPAAVSLSPANATNKAINWTSSDDTKVSVLSAQTQSGVENRIILEAYFSGTVTITATSDDNPEYKVSFEVSHRQYMGNSYLIGYGIYNVRDGFVPAYIDPAPTPAQLVSFPSNSISNLTEGFTDYANTWSMTVAKGYSVKAPVLNKGALYDTYAYPCLLWACSSFTGGAVEYPSEGVTFSYSLSGTGAQTSKMMFVDYGLAADYDDGKINRYSFASQKSLYLMLFTSTSTDSSVISNYGQAYANGTTTLSCDSITKSFMTTGTTYVPVSGISGGGTLNFD